MHRLGYTRYVAQGGDVGAAVTDAMGRQAPEGLVGVHINLLLAAVPIADRLPAASEKERAALAAIGRFNATGRGYFIEQATRPQTIGYSLLDSPVGLAAWMLDHDTDSYEKISRAFLGGRPAGNLKPERIVDNITLYWLTGTGASAARAYWETGRSPSACGRSGPSGALAPGRLHHVPGRDLGVSAELGRRGLPERHLLQRGGQRRSLRRLGGAADLRHRDARGVQVTAVVGPMSGVHTSARRSRLAAEGHASDSERLQPLAHRLEQTRLNPGRLLEQCPELAPGDGEQ